MRSQVASLGVLILAGGESKRMGFPKLILEYEGSTLLARAIVRAKQLSSTVLVVVGAYAELYRQEAKSEGVTVIYNPDWSEGLASSLRVGVRALQDKAGVLVMLPDQPFVTEAHLKALVQTWQEKGVQLVFSSYQGTLGAPTIVDQTLFAAVQRLRGDRGAKALLGEGVSSAAVRLEDARDIDTPQDANAIKNQGASK